MTNEALNALGQLLAAVSDALDEIATLQRRGPSRYRRLAALIISALVALIIMMVRLTAAVDRVRQSARDSRGMTRMLRPPEAWAAP